MTVFRDYARYYELLYAEKDYAAESRYIKDLLEYYVPGAKSILEFGCGNGKHAAALSEMGFAVHGVDRSPEMIASARARVAVAGSAATGRISFGQGDIRSISAGKGFDAVISLFHVISYQQMDEDLRAVFSNASRHLRRGGVFLFDCWYGPAVLSDPPAIRVKRFENETIAITRISEPTSLPDENSVIVDYTVFVEERATGAIRKIRESHRLRYLFTPEIDHLFAKAGMRRIHSAEWMSGRPPGLHTFGVLFGGCKEG